MVRVKKLSFQRQVGITFSKGRGQRFNLKPVVPVEKIFAYLLNIYILVNYLHI